MAPEPVKQRHATKTSSFGVGKRENHDSSEFYSRFASPILSDDEEAPEDTATVQKRLPSGAVLVPVAGVVVIIATSHKRLVF